MMSRVLQGRIAVGLRRVAEKQGCGQDGEIAGKGPGLGLQSGLVFLLSFRHILPPSFLFPFFPFLLTSLLRSELIVLGGSMEGTVAGSRALFRSSGAVSLPSPALWGLWWGSGAC